MFKPSEGGAFFKARESVGKKASKKKPSLGSEPRHTYTVLTTTDASPLHVKSPSTLCTVTTLIPYVLGGPLAGLPDNMMIQYSLQNCKRRSAPI